mmetsp:Transcript_13085/g.15949  ORF Transcript_13085/g.15949 Transcript_13085/m.15949 type:complete len:270 (+) Transcript_13085:31-840(+)
MKCKHVNVRLYEHKALLFFGILVTTFTFICIAVLTNDLQKSSCGILFDNLIKFEIPSHKYNIALSSVYTTAIWSVAQVLYSFNVAIQLASSLEQHSFFVKYEGHNDNEKDQQTDKSPIEIMEVPTLHLQDCNEPHHVNTQSVCFNFKEQRYHGKAGRKDGNLDEWNQSLNLQKPLLIPNIWTTNIKVTGDDDDDDNNNYYHSNEDGEHPSIQLANKILEDAFGPLLQTLGNGDIGRVMGYLAVRLEIDEDGDVLDVSEFCDTMQPDWDD